MNTYLLIEEGSKAFGDILLFNNITFSINQGQKVALIAKNGAGKTTLLNILAGKDSFDSGKFYLSKDITIGFLEQDPYFDKNLTVFEAVYGASNELMDTIREYEIALHSGDVKTIESTIAKMDFYNAWDVEVKIKQMLSILKLDNPDKLVSELSGGQVKRLALAITLINSPDFLILDEPTNHLDLSMIEWLEDYLTKLNITILMVTHDRYFLDRICNQIIEIDEKSTWSYNGNYSYFLEKRNERIISKNQQTEKAQNLLRRELEWIRRMPKARGTKAKYRIDAFYQLKEKAEYKRNEKQVDINVKSARLGNKILVFENVNKSFGDIKILDDFTYTFSRFEKIGIVGANGTGKTTFLNLITNILLPDAGKIEQGETVVFGFYQQKGIEFKPGQKVIDIVKEIAEIVTLGDGKQLSVSQFLTYFLFPPEMQYVMVEKLSGGEKRRLYLLTVLIRNPNFLILDEPTNDLDIVTLNVLEDYLAGFKGCLIIVSHDRFFMDKLVDHLFVFEGNGIVSDFPGNYSEYRESERLLEAEKVKQKSTGITKPKKTQVNRNETGTENKKLSFKEKKEIEQIEIDLESMENEKKQLETELSSGNLKPDDLIFKSERIGVLLKLIDNKTNRWLELSERN